LSEINLSGAGCHQQVSAPKQRRLLLVLLALVVVRGLLYVAIFPPWQHYDEPAHFEYVRLIVERGRLPRPGDYDPEMQREIAGSMKAAGFYRHLQNPTFSFWSDRPLNLGYTELEHPPLYYALLTLTQPLADHQGVETQLYLARLGSIALNLVVVAAAFALLTEILPGRRWLPLVVATFIALLPPFTDLMSGVNNDVGAAAVATLLLWASVRLIRRGPSLSRIGAVLLLAGACFATKNTSSLVAVVVLPILGLAHVPPLWRRWLLAGGALLGLAGLPVIFAWGGNAAHWHGYDLPTAANRTEVDTQWGRSALILSLGDAQHPTTVVQELDLQAGQALRGHAVTFGAWLRAAEGSDGPAILEVRDGTANYGREVQVTTEWQFQAVTATIGLDASGVATCVSLPYAAGAQREVYVDGAVLADGHMPVALPPQYETGQATTGLWNGQQFTNLLKNGSAEAVWPGLRPWIAHLRLYRRPVAQILHSVWDWPRTRIIYGFQLLVLFQSFWGRFSWSQLMLPETYFYPLMLLTAVGFIGAVIGFVRRARSAGGFESWRRWAWMVLGLTLLASWGATLFRVHPVFLVVRRLYFPMARYATVAIAPTAAFLCLGLAEIVPRRWRREAAVAGLLGMVVWEAIAMWTLILPYYYG
jgi:hypothetical protein